jgi:hypothetical protein
MTIDPYSIAEWRTLLSVQAEAAATLTGLVFVAVSINSDKIMAFPGLPGRAGESILQFLEVFFISSVVLVPQQRVKILAMEILLISVIAWVTLVVVQVRYLRVRAGHPWWWFGLRATLGQLATLPLILAGLMLFVGQTHALYWLVPGFVFCFAAAVISAWVLLIEILR